jgi:hypothetical protein
MADDHWFDTLHKSLLRDTPRRLLLHTPALIAGLVLGVDSAAKAARRRKKG